MTASGRRTLARLLLEQYVAEEHRGDDGTLRDLAVLALERALVRSDAAAIWTDVGGGMNFDPISVEVEGFASGDFYADTRAKVMHVVDWLVADLANGAGWLARTDRNGLPLKLTKIGSLDRATKEADKAMAKARSRMSASKSAAGEGETPHVDLADGWSLAKLETPEALDRESALMGHCIGNGAYDARLASGKRTYLSLRDPHGRPHATMEIDSEHGALLQIQGKGNEVPIDRHVLRLLPWLETEVATKPGDRSRLGIVEDLEGRLHHVSALPDDLSSHDDLEIDLIARPGRLPAVRLATTGRLWILAPYEPAVTRLPAEIEGGEAVALIGVFSGGGACRISTASLDLRGCSIDEIPRDLSVKGRIDLTGSDVRTIPDRLTASILDLTATRVESLPPTLAVGQLFLQDMPLAELPRLLRIPILSIRRTPISALPDATECMNLSIAECGSLAIGRELVVRDEFALSDVGGTTRIPSDAKIGSLLVDDGSKVEVAEGAEINAISVKHGSSISLPGGFRIRGSLNVRNSFLDLLPADLSVGGDMHLFHSEIDDLPAGLDVGGNLLLESGTKTIGPGTRVGGDLRIEGRTLTALPDGLRVGGDLILRLDAGVGTVGDDVFVGGAFCPSPSVVRIGRGLHVGSLDWQWARSLPRLPEGLVVEGDLDIRKCGLAEIPDDARIGGRILISMDDPEPVVRDRDRVGSLVREGTSGDEITDEIFGNAMFSAPVW